MPYWGWIVIGLAAAILAAVVLGVRAGRPRRLRNAFAPQKPHEQLGLRQISEGARNGYLERWRSTQERFADDPHVATMEADRLVLDVMRERGYPVDGLDRFAADISVDYPELVGSYRSAHEVAVRQSMGDATTDDLRRAMRHYRALFDELLETDSAERLVR